MNLEPEINYQTNLDIVEIEFILESVYEVMRERLGSLFRPKAEDHLADFNLMKSYLKIGEQVYAKIFMSVQDMDAPKEFLESVKFDDLFWSQFQAMEEAQSWKDIETHPLCENVVNCETCISIWNI